MNIKRKVYNIVRPKKKVELISIHIPKTAGTSLTKILKQQYPDAIELLYHNDLKKNEQMWKGFKIKLKHRGISCIHGHVPANNILRQYYPEAKIITWMRDPIDRMISTYNFYKKMPIHHNKVHEKFITKNWSLLDLAKVLGHETQSYFGDFKPEDFDFIGFTIHQQHSLEALSHLMNWQYTAANVYENVNPKKVAFSDDIKEQLSDILKEEIELYNKALIISSILTFLDN